MRYKYMYDTCMIHIYIYNYYRSWESIGNIDEHPSVFFFGSPRLVELVELVESRLESTCDSCSARLRRLGPVLWQAALLQLELVEEMLPKKLEVWMALVTEFL